MPVGRALASRRALELLLGICSSFPWLHPLKDFSLRKFRAGSLSVGPNCKSLNDQFNSAQTLFVVGYIGAAVLGGAGSYLLWVAPAESPKEGAGVATVMLGMTVNYQGRF